MGGYPPLKPRGGLPGLPRALKQNIRSQAHKLNSGTTSGTQRVGRLI